MKRNHSFTFVTLVNDVILTSGKEISNICFQFPAVLLTLLTLLASDLSNWFENWRQSNTTLRLLKVHDAIIFKWWFDDLTARARASLPARHCPPRPVLVEKFSRKFIVFANKVSIFSVLQTKGKQFGTYPDNLYAFQFTHSAFLESSNKDYCIFGLLKGPLTGRLKFNFRSLTSALVRKINNSTICKFDYIFSSSFVFHK